MNATAVLEVGIGRFAGKEFPVHVEQATVEHEDRRYTAGGFLCDPWRIVAYLGKTHTEHLGGPPYTRATGALQDWKTNVIGQFIVTGRWATPRSWMSSHMHAVRATVTIDGEVRTYVGRSAGSGMIFRGRRSAAQAPKPNPYKERSNET